MNYELRIMFKTKLFFFVLLLTVILDSLFFIPPALAQSLSLSISPPILEVMIMPGKQVSQTFTIANNGQDGYAKFTLAQFFPKDEYGNISVDDAIDLTGSPLYAGWFYFEPKVFIGGGKTEDITLKISPPETAPEKDYYFTFFYELDDEGLTIGGDSSGNTTKAKVGANILLSVSKDGLPAKKAGQISLEAPKIIDSLQGLTYKLRVGNGGQFLFKPIGSIEIAPFFGKKEILNLAPVNIVSSSARIVPCLSGEALIECKIDKKVLLGIYKAKVSFTADENGREYSAEAATIAFPFSIIFAATTIILGYLTIKKLIKKTAA